MSTLLSAFPGNLPTKGKSTPAADPSQPDKTVSSKNATRKKNRAGDPPVAARRKPFRQHLDQAMGKAASVAIPMLPESQPDRPQKTHLSRSLSSPDASKSNASDTLARMTREPSVQGTSGHPAPLPAIVSGKEDIRLPQFPEKTGNPKETVRSIPAPAGAPSSVILPENTVQKPLLTGRPGSAGELPSRILRRVPDGDSRTRQGADLLPKQSPAVPVRPDGSGGDPGILASTVTSYGTPVLQKEGLSRSSSPADGKESGAAVLFPEKDAAVSGGSATPVVNTLSGERRSGLTGEDGNSGEHAQDNGKNGNDPSSLQNPGMLVSGGPVVSGAAEGKGEVPAVRVPHFPERVSDAVRNGGGRIMLEVHPPALGPVRVTVQVDPRSKVVEVHLDVKDTSVRKALEGKEGDLRQLLKNEGFSMNRLDVSVNGLSVGSGMNLGSSDSQPGGTGVQSDGSGPFRPDLSGGTTLFSGESTEGRGEGATAQGSGEREAPQGDRGIVFSDPEPREVEDGGYHRIA